MIRGSRHCQVLTQELIDNFRCHPSPPNLAMSPALLFADESRNKTPRFSYTIETLKEVQRGWKSAVPTVLGHSFNPPVFCSKGDEYHSRSLGDV